jgi:tRNA-2-methylthio-N6-dimethylallyladenosine synthase
VLVEEAQRPGHWRGRTRTNKLVFFDSDHVSPGDLVSVRIEWTGPWSLKGSLDSLPNSDAAAASTPAVSFRRQTASG